jgi:hypothetical protein
MNFKQYNIFINISHKISYKINSKLIYINFIMYTCLLLFNCNNFDIIIEKFIIIAHIIQK